MSQALQAQDGSPLRVTGVTVRGSGTIPSRQLERWLGLSAKEAFTDEALEEASLRLLRRLQDRGYYFATIDSMRQVAEGNGVRVEVKVSEGPQVVLGKVQFEGVGDKEKAQLEREWRLPSGRLLSAAEFNRQLHRIVRNYEDRGYPYCRIELAEMELAAQDGRNQQTLDIVLRVIPGPLVVVSRIDVRGNVQTRRNVILRELGLREGDLYSQTRVDDIARRLRSLGYFKRVEEPVLLQQSDGSGRLLIKVVEGNNNRFDGVLGYNPAAAGRSGYLTGLLDVSFGNLFGTGRQISARWEKRSRETQQLQLSYREPWVAGLPLHAGIGFEQLAQDTTYLQRGWFLDLKLPVSDRLSIGGRLSGESVTPDSLGSTLFGVPRSRTLSAGLSLEYRTVDDPLNPRSGVVYVTSAETGRKRIDPFPGSPLDVSQSFSRKRLSLDFEVYFEPLRWHVLALSLHGRQVTSTEPFVSLSDQFRLGGALTLRGYREEQFRGSRIAWSSLEYRYLLGPASRAFAFLDAGYFWREEEAGTVEATKVGYGVGISVETRLGMISIAYGLGEGDGFMDGKVHLRLINRF
jgi:outer membrane protein insertion porin family